MTAQADAKAGKTANKPVIRRPPRATVPAAAAATAPAAADDDEIIELTPGAPEGEEPEPERVALFKIGGDVYTMLANPTLALARQAMDVAYDRGEAYAEVFVMREMLGEEAYRALLGNKSLKGPQLNAITARVTKRLYGALERESARPNP
jgi:hypothetical protein